MWGNAWVEEQRVCDRSKMYGRRLFSHTMEILDTKLFVVYPVYSRHEYRECDCGGIRAKLYGR